MTRKILLGFLAAVLALTLLFFLGPRVPVDTTVSFDPERIGADVAAYLDASEAAFPALREGLGKEIVWAYPESRAKTPLAIVYLHGFSASKGEVRPLTDRIAQSLQANLFYTRLTGHGLDGEALAGATVNDWVNDTVEAVAVGRVLGEKVIVVATSTGGGLATWAATQPGLFEGVAGFVLLSPNYRLLARGSDILTMPWGRQIARMVAGAERGFAARNELHEKFWTSSYPIEATLPMAAVTQLAYDAPIETIAIPALFAFSDTDPVVSARATREIAARWGAPHELIVVEPVGGESDHVIAGDALSPSRTEALVEQITAWIRALPE